MISILRENGVEIQPRRISSLERNFCKLLSELNIKYEQQFKLDGSYFDFYIQDNNLLIEINGDYWHGNPKVYKKTRVKFISKRIEIERQREKKKKSRKNGYKILFLWERDLKTKLEKKLSKKIKEYLK